MILEEHVPRIRVEAHADRDRDIGLDVLRAVAILIVMALHWANSPLPASATSVWDDAFIRFATHGTYGVALFFVLSGFLITRAAMLREANFFGMSARDFYSRRIARIQPLYLAVVALGFIAIIYGPTGSRIFRYTFRDPGSVFGGEFVVSLLTFTYNWEMIAHHAEFLFRGLNWDVMWSLAVEEQFYLAFPLLVVWTRTRRRLTIALLFIVAIGVSTRIALDAAHVAFNVRLMNSFSCFDTIAIGVLCALWRDKLRIGPVASDGLVLLGAGMIFTACYRGGIVPLVLGACLFIGGSRETRLFRNRGWRILARIGQLSYGLYLFQALALWLTAPAIEGGDVVLAFILFVGVTLLIAEASYRYYEVPLNNLLRRVLLRSPIIPAYRQ
jgi:peptidoglycan/LPS O-acetylase OafA/YrhL